MYPRRSRYDLKNGINRVNQKRDVESGESGEEVVSGLRNSQAVHSIGQSGARSSRVTIWPRSFKERTNSRGFAIVTF